jgi:hypothetical protein
MTFLLSNGTINATEADSHVIQPGTTGGFVQVKADDPWQPNGFNEAHILRAGFAEITPEIDGKAGDPAWAEADSLTVPLTMGNVSAATLKAVYTEDDIYLQVSWADPTKDDQHHPWVYDDRQGKYFEGPQVEDGLLVSIEAGCDWDPSVLAGTVYDFDGWLWLAARSDPIGQAVDVVGNVQDRWIPGLEFKKYQSRYEDPVWDLKIIDRRPDILTESWQSLDRQYKRTTPKQDIYVRYQPDGKPVQDFALQMPPPPVSAMQKVNAVDPMQEVVTVPQYRPVKLTGDAGEVKAKGHWQNGRWTVEFRRTLVTPANNLTDSVFKRTTQFSIHVFDHTEDIDKASESVRLLLEFVPDESNTPDVLTTQNTP